MGGRRTRPLILVLLAGWLVIVGRLAQLQWIEHDTWALEAAKLERSGTVLPYERGAILDARDRVLVEDRPVYRLELTYRDFRRGHPLGIVTHARSALERRAVPLPEALDDFTVWAEALVRTSPAELHRFGRGGALAILDLEIASVEQPFREQRSTRASDLRYYARTLLAPDRLEARRLIKFERKTDNERSYLEEVAAARGHSVDEVLEDCRRAWAESIEGLDALAGRIAADAAASDEGWGRGDPFEALIADLESWRRSVEDAAAARLFRETLGFGIGRLAPRAVGEHLELSWLADELRWRPDRVEQWYRGEREDFLAGWRDGFAVPRLMAELRVRKDLGVTPERALDLLMSTFLEADGLAAALDGRERSWRRPGRIELVDDLEESFALESEPAALPPDRWPFASLGVERRSDEESGDLDWDDLCRKIGPVEAREAVFDLRAADARLASVGMEDLASLWREAAPRSRPDLRVRSNEIASALLDSLERDLQRFVEARLIDLRTAAGGGRLEPSEERLDRLGERARHLLRDYGSRRALLIDEPSYDVVYLLTREPERYPGIRARAERERMQLVQPDERGLPAATLIGSVSALDPDLAQRQRSDTLELRRLQRKVERSESERARLRTLMRTLLLTDEDRGVSGIEAVCDPWLRGRNGYRERLGLEDVYGRGSDADYLTPVIDGENVRLTVDADLQEVATRVINEPRRPPADVETDEGWYRSPVGAIVLARPDGRILAAASAPDAWAAREAEESGREHDPVYDRTLRAPAFQPLGSVFKPFVALHALTFASHAIDPSFTHDCRVEEGESWAGWGGVRCNARWGHGPMNMSEAIAVSCNSYFARLADELSTNDFEALGMAFGFGKPSGVVLEGAPVSRALELNPTPFRWNEAADYPRQRRRAANGLQVVEVTPVQVARAMAGLATGELPSMRLVDSIGGTPIEVPAAESLPYPERHMEAVRSMMVEVTNAPDGSATSTLSRERLGFEVAAKTGSADLQHRRARGEDGEGVILKHTWVAGWFPADDPQLVFVVFLNATEVSSSRAAIYVAGQLLEQPEVRALVEAEPNGRGGAR